MQLRADFKSIKKFFNGDNSPILAFIVIFSFFVILAFPRINSQFQARTSNAKTQSELNTVTDFRGIYAQNIFYDDVNVIADNSHIPGSSICSTLNGNSTRILKIGDSITNNAGFMPGAVDIAFDGASTFWFVGDDRPAERAAFEREISNGGFAALIMLGTNDCGGINVNNFISNLRNIVNQVRSNGIIPILSTIPPRTPTCAVSGYNEAIIALSREYTPNLPLRDSASMNPNDFPDGIHPNSSGVATFNNSTCSIINSLKQSCDRDFSFDCGSSTPVVNPNSNPNPNPVPQPQAQPNNPGPNPSGATTQVASGMCSKLGINTAVMFSNGSATNQYGRGGTGWLLAIAENPSDINPSEICGKPQKTIIRPWCTGVNCGMFTSQLSELAGILNSFPCEVYVTGPNEPESELHDASNIAQAAAEMTNNLAAAVTNPNVRILTPVINATHPNRGSFVPALSRALNWGEIHGIAMNSYSLPGSGTASSFVNDVMGLIGVSKPVYITETGPIEQNSGVDRDTAIANLTNELNALTSRSDVQAVLFFNGSGLNPDPNFAYGCINGAELPTLSGNSCSDDGFDCKNTGDGSIFNGEAGCCENKAGNELSSCTVDTVIRNGGQDEALDAVNAGVQMKKNADGTWFYKYAVTQHIHNVPLLEFLSAIEGTDKHPVTTDAEDDNSLNFNEELHFTNQFPGIATFELTNGANFQLQVPSLGTSAAAGEYNRRNFFDQFRPHCGLFYESDSAVNGVEPLEKDDFIKTWLDDSQSGIVKFDESAKKNFFEGLLDFISRFFGGGGGGSTDTCVDKCTDDSAGTPIRACDYTDAYTFDRRFFEIIIDGNIIKGEEDPYMAPLTPRQVCDHMFLTQKVAGGTCHLGGPGGNISLDDTVGESFDLVSNPGLRNLLNSLGLNIAPTQTGISESLAYDTLIDAGFEPKDVTGTPFFRIDFGGTPTLKLEGLLKTLEETYRIERYYAPRTFEGYKICHNNNVGIKVPSTKRLYDYYLNPAIAPAGEDKAPNIFEELIDPKASPKQIFYGVDGVTPRSQYGMCKPATHYFDIKERANSVIATNIAAQDRSATQVTIAHYFPWVGQIPLMWERIAVWGLNLEHDFTNPNPDLNKILTIITEIKETQIDFADVYLFPCGFFDPYINNQYSDPNYSVIKQIVEQGLKGVLGYDDDKIKAVANGDCICGQSEDDPLEQYLEENGKLQEEIKLQSRDADGDGIPDICSEINPDDSGNPDDGGSPNTPPGDPIDTSDLISPVKTVTITQDYGPSPYYYGDQGYFHSGIDLGTKQPIYAAGEGRVIWAGWDRDGSQYNADLLNFTQYGIHVTIEHPGGLRTKYAHMESTSVQIGDTVEQGQQIGVMGATGRADGVHLHFEILNGACKWTDIDCFINPEEVVLRGNNVIPPIGTGGDNGSGEDTEVEKMCEEAAEENQSDNVVVDPDYRSPEGSTKDHICLAKKVANFLNGYNNKARIPWYVIVAAWESETKRRCAPLYATFFTTLDENRITKDGTGALRIGNGIGTAVLRNGRQFEVYDHLDACGGDPNQLALTDVQTLDKNGKGIGGHLKGTFLAIIKNWYWYKPSANADDTGDLLSACMDHLGVNRSIGQEDSSEPYGAYWDWTNSSGYSVPEAEKSQLKDQFSRKRVGDALCAMAIQLAENGADNLSSYVSPQEWTYDTIINASYGYYGACEFRGGNYCENMIARSELFKDLYDDVSCN